MNKTYTKHKNLLGIPTFILTLAVLYYSSNFVLQFIHSTFSALINSNTWYNVIYSLLHYSQLPFIMLVGTYFVLRLEQKNFSTIFLDWNKKSLKYLFISTFVTLAIVALIYLLEFFMDWIDIPGFGYRDERFLFAPRMVKVIFGTFCTAFMEELFGRGVLMLFIERLGGKSIAILTTSILFGLMHLPGAMGNSSLYMAPFNLFILGVLLALLVYSYKSLWVAIGIHFGWNLAIYNIFNLSGQSDFQTLAMITNMTGPEWVVGSSTTPFGIESGIITFVLFSSSILLLYVFKKEKIKSIFRISDIQSA